MPDSNSGAGMKYMSFKAFKDIGFTEPVPDTPKDGFKVMINPETFERSLGVKPAKEKTSRSGNSSGTDAGLEAEKYAFDLIFDGTGVAGPKMDGEKLNAHFQTFLNVAYATRASQKEKKKRNFVELSYCGEIFYCKMESMTIQYQLFQPDGYPIRIKVNCHFSSVEEPKKDAAGGKKGKTDKKKSNNVNRKTPNRASIETEKSYDETLEAARKNNSMSVMTCGCPMSQMSSEVNATPYIDYGYSPVSGEYDYTPTP